MIDWIIVSNFFLISPKKWVKKCILIAAKKNVELSDNMCNVLSKCTSCWVKGCYQNKLANFSTLCKVTIIKVSVEYKSRSSFETKPGKETACGTKASCARLLLVLKFMYLRKYKYIPNLLNKIILINPLLGD